VDVGKSAVAELDGAVTEGTAILGRPPRLIVVDYLGLLGSGSKNLPLYQRVSEAAVDVKSFAKRHAAAVVLLSQAGRDVDRKRSAGAAELGLDAARDSGQVEEAADFLVTLWRPELDPDLQPEGRREVAGQLMGALVKNRRGPRPPFRLAFDVQTLRINDWPEES
jgi:replicative DNA helicase